jgi:hypothetical protein
VQIIEKYWEPQPPGILRIALPQHFITLASCPMKIHVRTYFQRFRLRLCTTWAVHVLLQHKNGARRGWNTFVIKDVRFLTVSLSASRHILRQHFNKDRPMIYPKFFTSHFSKLLAQPTSQRLRCQGTRSCSFPKACVISRHISNVHNMAILLKWLPTKWVGEYRKKLSSANSGHTTELLRLGVLKLSEVCHSQ